MVRKRRVLKYLKLIHNKIRSDGINIYIEISGRCNAKCPYCARQRFKHRHSGDNMSPLLFEKILNHLTAIGLLNEQQGKTICLYNWGEPFLNPHLNEILGILNSKNLNAEISSNFFNISLIDEANFPVISSLIFSLSGFSQSSYGKIHGGNLEKTLNNFEHFYGQFIKGSPESRIKIAWHRYQFNENELWQAYKYFNRSGIIFQPTIAYFNDLKEMLRFAEGALPEARLEQAQNDLFLDHINENLKYYSKIIKPYHCVMWNYLVVDETGKLLLCCGMTNKDADHVLGNVTEMSSEEIYEKKMRDPICKKCIASGFPQSIDSIGKKSLPKDGGKNYYKLWCQMNLYSVLAQMVKKVAGK